MTTQKKTTQEVTEKQSEAVVSETPDLATIYKQQVALLDQIAAQAKAAGIELEKPPSDIVSYKESVPAEAGNKRQLKPGQSLGEGLTGGWVPWRKQDLDATPEEKYNFVPIFIPGAVHPLKDENGMFKIILDVNDLKCCLTVGELCENISGMFYHAYKNLEDEYRKREQFKSRGPESGPHTTGGRSGQNTWHYEPEAPSAWIDLDGRYYTPGADIPEME